MRGWPALPWPAKRGPGRACGPACAGGAEGPLTLDMSQTHKMTLIVDPRTADTSLTDGVVFSSMYINMHRDQGHCQRDLRCVTPPHTNNHPVRRFLSLVP